MRSVSTAFRRTMSQRRNFVNYADMTLSNGTVLHLQPKDFRLGGNSYTDETSDGDNFTIGTTLGKNVTIALDNTDEQFSRYDFYKAVFVLYEALLLEDEETTEKVRIGAFTVITPATTGTVITMEAVDNMYKFDRPYSESNLVYPCTLQQVVADACLRCGVQDNTGQFNRYNLVVNKRPDDDDTFRQVISWVAQIACVNARIDDLGALKFIWYEDVTPETNTDGGNYRKIYDPQGHYDTGADVDGGSFAYNDGANLNGGSFTDVQTIHNLASAKNVQVGTDDITITGVRVVNGKEVDILVGTDDYVITVQDNPLTDGIESSVANGIYARIANLTFRPFSMSYLQDPTIEAGDWVIVVDIKRNTYLSFVTSLKFTNGGYMTMSCKAQSPTKQASVYKSAAAMAVVKALRATEQILSNYDEAVQRMNALAMNAMGLFTYEQGDPVDGSSIYYLSNRPITDNNGVANFTQGSKLWKLTGDGFFCCSSAGITDAQCTWTAGWDANNNVVINTLSAIGITFDWARGGTLTLGGDNNVNGVLSVLNAQGRERAHIDNTGIKVGDSIGSKIYISTDGNLEYYYDNAYAGQIYMDAVNYGTQEEPDLRDTFLIEDFNDIGIRSADEMSEIYLSTQKDDQTNYDNGYVRLYGHKQTGESSYQYSELTVDGNGIHFEGAIYVGGSQGQTAFPRIIESDFMVHDYNFKDGVFIGKDIGFTPYEAPNSQWHQWPSPTPSTYYTAIMLGVGVTTATFPNLDSDDSIAYEPFIKCADGVSPPKITDMVRSGTSITVTFTAVTSAQVGSPVAPATSECVIKLLRIKG